MPGESAVAAVRTQEQEEEAARQREEQEVARSRVETVHEFEDAQGLEPGGGTLSDQLDDLFQIG